MKLLALDLSKNATGWAVDGIESICPPRLGTWRPPKGRSIGHCGLAFQNWLYSSICEWGVDHLVYESPMVGRAPRPGKKSIVMNEETTIVLVGMAFACEVIAASRSMPTSRVAISTWRKLFLGHGRPNDPKELAMECCRRLGWDAPSQDAAEAAGIWVWGKSCYDREFRLEEATPLFAGRAR